MIVGENMKKKKIFIVVGIVILLIAIGFGLFKYLEYRNSDYYKLKELGYSEEDTSRMLDKFEEKQIVSILKKEYDENIPKLMKQKYFMFDNLDRYLSYIKTTNSKDLKDVVSVVNVGADKDFYEDTKPTDTSKGILMLVNKYHYLSENFVPENITDISVMYAYDDNQATEEAYEAYKSMWYAAKNEGLLLITNSTYRDYESQDIVYTSYKYSQGQEWADGVAARPGYSEHQTGLAFDILTNGYNMDDFETSDEFKWLNKNAHKYGFILRYPKGKEHITGYSYESWHYRYVGVKVATEVHEKDITYDEYYEFYLK